MFGLIVAVKQVYDKYAEDEMTVYARPRFLFSLSCLFVIITADGVRR